jgi:hypothetical protein
LSIKNIPNWFTQVTAATEAGLLRELVMMQALQLELTRKRFIRLKDTFVSAWEPKTALDVEQAAPAVGMRPR